MGKHETEVKCKSLAQAAPRRYSPGKVVILASHSRKFPLQYRCVWGTWKGSSCMAVDALCDRSGRGQLASTNQHLTSPCKAQELAGESALQSQEREAQTVQQTCPWPCRPVAITLPILEIVQSSGLMMLTACMHAQVS